MPPPPSPARSSDPAAADPVRLHALLLADVPAQAAALVERLARGGMQADLVTELPDAAAPRTASPLSVPLSATSAPPVAWHCDALVLGLDWPLDRLVPLLVSLRGASRAPIALLRHAADEDADIAALEAGFDAAWQATIDDRVLWARLRALARRARGVPVRQPVLRVGALMVDRNAALATLAGRALRLTRAQFDVLAVLAAHPQRVVARPVLERAMGASAARPRALDATLSRLRLRLQEAGAPLRVVTVPRRGYRLEVVVARR